MRRIVLIGAALTLVATLLLPGTAEAGGDSWGGGGPGLTCPDGYELEGEWCVKRVVETFDADEHIDYECPDGFSGPNRAKKCRKVTHERFPATPITQLTCPDDFVGPDSAGQCSKTETVTEVVHVDESTELVCLDTWTLLDGECVREVETIFYEDPVLIADRVCPDGYDGPNDVAQCTREVEDVVAATPVDIVRCPEGWTGPDADNNCSRSRIVDEVVGAGFVTTTTCADGFTLDAPRPECIAQYPATVELTCPAGFEVVDGPLGAECVDPNSSLPGPLPTESISCSAPSSTVLPIVDPFEPPMCEIRIPASSVGVARCPAGYVGPDADNRCVIETVVTDVVPAIVVSVLECPAEYVGPDANQQCVRTVVETVVASEVSVEACLSPRLGPDADGRCVFLAFTTERLPAIERPVFACPAGFDGPDSMWNCSRETTETIVIDADIETLGYECPSDSSGPDADNQCSRRTVEKVNATEVVTYRCPHDSDGPDANNQCTKERIYKVRPNGHVCRIKFYDYPDGSRLLFSEKRQGAYNLRWGSAHLNDDVESVRVPEGCTVSVAEHHGGAGWCFTLEAGLHNLPDDEMSWFSIPGTGCSRS